MSSFLSNLSLKSSREYRREVPSTLSTNQISSLRKRSRVMRDRRWVATTSWFLLSESCLWNILMNSVASTGCIAFPNSSMT